MKRFLFCMMLMATMTAHSQEVTLDEVVVSSARTVQLADRQVIYPTRQQLEHSHSGYSLLQKLSLPHIRIDEASHTITALSSKGVEVRINDRKASTNELLSLDVKAVERIEFIDNPGVRYGDGLDYVINIIVRQATSGYVIGTDLTNTLTSVSGSENVFGKVNFGLSELGASYTLNYLNSRGESFIEQAHYLMPDGTTLNVDRHSEFIRQRSLSHTFQLSYSLSDTNYIFQARLNGQRNIRPTHSFTQLNVDNIYAFSRSDSRQKSPSLDLYFHHDLPHQQSLTANVVGTYISSQSHNENNEGGQYLYHTHGRTYSLWAEALYENQFRPFTLSSGLQWAQRYTSNLYEGDTQAHNGMHTSSLYGFSQLSGRLWQRLSYVAGFGLSRRYYRQAAASHDFLLMRPKLSLSYSLARHWRVKYDVELSQHVSQIALISDVSIKQNALETLVGNSDLRPNRVVVHDLRLSYTTPRLMAELQGYYSGHAHPNMVKIIPTADGHFLRTQSNQKAINFFFLESYNRWTIVPERLELSCYGSVYRFFNLGDDYTHTYTSFNGAAWLQAYLGKWTLMVYADNGYHWMEGHNRGHEGADWQLSASYSLSPDLTLALYARHPFSAHPTEHQAQFMDRYIQKDMISFDRDQGNRLSLNLTWKFCHGRHYRSIQRTMEHHDSETGILK